MATDARVMAFLAAEQRHAPDDGIISQLADLMIRRISHEPN